MFFSIFVGAMLKGTPHASVDSRHVVLHVQIQLLLGSWTCHVPY